MGNEIITCAVVGATGRMGRRICEMISTAENFRLAGATERAGHPQFGRTLQEVLGSIKSEVRLATSLEEITTPFDIIIDFTFPAVSMKTVQFACREKKPAVIGSTGFSPEEMREIRELSIGFPCVCTPNMSMGVNLLFALVRQVAQILGDAFDVEVLEAHHRNKKDAPSGTAVKIAQILAEAYGRDLSKVGVYERKGFIGERKKDEIGIQSLRAGDIVGDHTVLFGGPGERLELTHRAHSRDTFVYGALRAARWIIDKPNGLYDMQDVLGLK
jgi:4-hydroxy-tetrahydrodipicolinate reductase